MVALDTPLLRVSRPVAACSRCRSAKVKCDGKLPACSACERAGKGDDCSSTSDEFAKGKERNYVATLEMRIEKLEAKIKEIREEKERRKSSSVMAEFDTMTRSRRTSENPSSIRKQERAAMHKEASNIDELVSDFGYLAVNSSARDYYGFTSSVSYCRLILSACTKEPMSINRKKEMPPRITAQAHIQQFLSNIFVLYPIFDEASLFSVIDAVYQSRIREATPYDFWSVRMVLAIACASRSGERGDTEYLDAVGYVNAALQDAEFVLRPGSVAAVQSMLLLVLYSMLDPYHFDTWTILGATSRALVDLGLHQDVPKGTTMSRAKHWTRKRAFWCLYALDRSTSLAHARAFSFSDQSHSVGKVRLVEGEDLVALNLGRRQNQEQASHPDLTPAPVLFMQPIMPAIALFALRKIQSRFYTDLFQSGQSAWPEPYPYIWAALKSLHRWWRDLPSSINHVSKDFLELEMLYSRVCILRPSPRVPHICALAQALIFEYATSYAAKMFRLLYSARKGEPVRAAPLSYQDVMKAHMIGSQLLDVLQHCEDAVLCGGVLESPPVPPNSASPPPLTPTPLTAQEMYYPGREVAGPPNAGRAISCISMFDDILGWLGVRWDEMDWQKQFQRDAKPVLERLQLWTTGPFLNPISPPSTEPDPLSNISTISQTQPTQDLSFTTTQGRNDHGYSWL